MHIVGSSTLNQLPHIDVTVNDAARAKRLLDIASQLSQGVGINCPADFGYVYDIDWSEAGRKVATASVHAAGCRELRLDNGVPMSTTPAFWDALANLVGIAEPSLHPVPTP